MNHLFNVFSVRLQTLSYIIILSIPFNAFNHRSKISIFGLNYSRYHMQIHWSTRDKENCSHSERTAYPINVCTQEKKNKEMLIWQCFLFRLAARNNWIGRACSFPYYFLRTLCQNISVFNMIDKYTVSSLLYYTSALRFISIVTSNSHFSLGQFLMTFRRKTYVHERGFRIYICL